MKILKVIIDNIFGVSIGTIGLISALTAYLSKNTLDNELMTYRVFLLILTLFIIILSLCCIIIYKLYREKSVKDKFKVIEYNNRIGEYILWISKDLNVNTLVGVYYEDGNYNLSIGLGIITSSDRFTQFKIINYNDDFKSSYNDVLNKIFENDSNVLKNIIVQKQISNEMINIGVE